MLEGNQTKRGRDKVAKTCCCLSCVQISKRISRFFPSATENSWYEYFQFSLLVVINI